MSETVIPIVIAAIMAVVGTLMYVFWLRPLLRLRPSLKQFYDREDSLWAAIRLKTAGIKQHLTVGIVGFASIVVELYDLAVPVLQQSGFDVTRIVPQIPAEAWPFINLVILGLITYFRHVSDQRNAALITQAAETGKLPENTGLPGLPNMPEQGSK